jgi:hypothetical protein
VTFVLTMVLGTPQDTEHDATPKAVPVPRALPPGADRPLGTPAAPLVVPASDPLARALALQSELRALGVAADVFPLGATARVSARIDAGQRDAVARLLTTQGLAWPPGEALEVEFSGQR